MILRFEITNGSRSPALAESVELGDDGTISGWRTVSPAGVGWFARRLPEAELAEVRALAGAVRTAPAPSLARPGASTETLELDATGPYSIAGSRDGLAVAARQLVQRLTDFPRAAVTVTHPSPEVARLEHRGTEPLRLDLASVAVSAAVWRGYYEPAGTWSGVIGGPGEIEAGPGWTLDLPLEVDAPADPGITVHLAVDFAIRHGGSSLPVEARYEPDIEAPDIEAPDIEAPE